MKHHAPLRVVVATGNAGKLRELRACLADLPLSLVAQGELDVASPTEDGLSFVENALIKARHAARITGLPALADDSGIEVPALGGGPGIYSARYAGEGASDDDNVRKLLAEMQSLQGAQRQARFRCVIVFMRHAEDPVPLICEGAWEGHIADTPGGKAGFGYDPVFRIAGDSRTAAELAPEEKNRLSHRAVALRQLRDHLQSEIPAISFDTG